MALKLVEVTGKPFYAIYEEKPAKIEVPKLPLMECREATDLMTMLRGMTPLIVYGAPQSGKTRLLQAVAAGFNPLFEIPCCVHTGPNLTACTVSILFLRYQPSRLFTCSTTS